jgi:uncharacterized membrane protein YeaQ/YmgE (transglycosylase-associated protein family)
LVVGAIGWIVLGLMAGIIASKLMNKRGEGLLLDMLLGIIGAVSGGWAFNAVSATGVTGFNVWSLVFAVVGAVALLAARHLTVGFVGGAVVLLVVWDAIRRSDSRAQYGRSRKE